jgi:mannose-6-phosphate isomerase-like protein (cupin superfamily)
MAGVTAKVSVRRLPDVAPPIPQGGGRIVTAAGELAQIVNGESYRYLAFLEFQPDPNAPRGNHYHAQKTEHLYIVDGLVRAAYRDLDTGETAEVDLTAGDLVVVRPRCAHAYIALEQSHAVEFSPLTYDSADTIAYVLREVHRVTG